MGKFLVFLGFQFLTITFLFLLLTKTTYAAEIIKPATIWQRSTEAQDKVVLETTIGSKIQQALQLPLDPNQIVFDNGIFTPSVNKTHVPFGNQWASWKQYSSVSQTSCGPVFELRHFQAKFNFQQVSTFYFQRISIQACHTSMHLLPSF